MLNALKARDHRATATRSGKCRGDCGFPRQEFIQDLEKMTQHRIALQKRGPREKIVTDRSQGELTFDA